MANKQNFTPVEWTKVLESGMLASMAVTAAEPSGLWGTLMETFAGGSAFAASKHDPSANELIKSVIADFETVQGRAAVAQGDARDFAIWETSTRAAKPNLRFQELRDEGAMTERWPHRGRSRPGRPSSAQVLRWHIG